MSDTILVLQLIRSDSVLVKSYKVITTMVIRPPDNRTRYAQSVVADLQPLGLGYVGAGDGRIR